MIRPLRFSLALLASFALFGACDSGPTGGGGPGTLKVVLSSPNATDDAILIRLDGPDMSDVVVSGTGRTSYVRTVSATRIVVAIVGPVSSGEQLRFDVPDTKRSADYLATVLEVSDATNALRATPASYTLRVQR